MVDHGRRTREGKAGGVIASYLRSRILDGTLTPGSRIRQEEVAERFSGSRAPVREALSMLVGEGLVTVVANSGAWVSTLTLEECQEIYQMRERLEPLLLRYSAPSLTDADFVTLEQLVEKTRIASQKHDIDGFMQFDRELHLATYKHAQTLQLDDVIGRLWNSTAPYRRAYVARWSEEYREIANHEHELLIITLRDGDLNEAERILAGHIRRTRRQLVRHKEIFSSTTIEE